MPPSLETIADAYRAVALDSPRVLTALLPEVDAALARHGLARRDGPPASFPTRVSFEDLTPYLVAFSWPSSIGADGSVKLHICGGVNGLGELANVDDDLADAAVLSLQANAAAAGVLGELVEEARGAAAYANATTDDGRLQAVRRFLAERLPHDDEFLGPVRRQAAALLPLVGMRCTNCGAPEAATSR